MGHRMDRLGRCLGIFGVAWGFSLSSASAATRFVPQDYPTIQAAINASFNGDTVIIQSGTYFETVDTLGKDISLNGVGVNSPTIDGTGLSGPLITVSPGSEMPNLSNLTLRDGDGILGGAMLIGSGTEVTIRNVRFWFNTAAAGGAVTVGTNADVRFVDCDFWQNSADSDGGAIFSLGGATILVEDTIFEANTAGDDGGAVSIFNASFEIRSNSAMIDNIAGKSGGGLMLDGGAVGFGDDTVFRSNEAMDHGGGVAAVGSDYSSFDCFYNGNSAGGTGGGIDGRSGATVSSREDYILRNDALSGGGAAVFEARIELEGANIYENTCNNFGGGVYVASNDARAEGFFYSCLFQDNEANYGAAARVSSSGSVGQNPEAVALFMNCWVNQNRSNLSFGSGGIGAFEHSGAGIQTIVEVINCTVAGNLGGAVNGLNGVGAPRIDIENSIVWGNNGTSVSNSVSRTNAQYSIFPEAATYAGPGNMNVDPGLEDINGLFLRGDSPAIDAGRNASVAPDLLDLDGDGSVFEATPFDYIGAPRFVNDPVTADTGSGSGAKVDIGALEFPRTCIADLAPGYGALNFLDLSQFLSLFNAQDPAADLAAPFGVWNFFDLGAFLDAFNGC